jgi:hypothetical protein
LTLVGAPGSIIERSELGAELEFALLDVSPFFTEVVALHKPSASLIVSDAIWRVRGARAKAW